MKRRDHSDLTEVFKMAKNLSPIPLNTYFELNTDNRTCGHSLKLVKRHWLSLQLRNLSTLFLRKSHQPLEHARPGYSICNDCEQLQVQIRTGKNKKDGPGLKSAGPRGRSCVRSGRTCENHRLHI